MAGHSHSHNIAKRKGVQDSKRSKEFTTVARQISSAVKKTGIANPNENPALRLAIDKARSINMPNDIVKRAIDRGAGKSESGATLQEILYEGYGPHGVGVMIQVRTDNVQRTSPEIRHAFSASGGSLAGPGAAGYLFTLSEGEYVPSIPITLSTEQFDELTELITELDEMDDVDGVWHNAVVV